MGWLGHLVLLGLLGQLGHLALLGLLGQLGALGPTALLRGWALLALLPYRTWALLGLLDLLGSLDLALLAWYWYWAHCPLLLTGLLGVLPRLAPLGLTGRTGSGPPAHTHQHITGTG